MKVKEQIIKEIKCDVCGNVFTSDNEGNFRCNKNGCYNDVIREVTFTTYESDPDGRNELTTRTYDLCNKCQGKILEYLKRLNVCIGL